MLSCHPLCSNSGSPANNFCCVQDCTLPAFYCNQCPDQSCLRAHKHSPILTMFWDETSLKLHEILFPTTLYQDEENIKHVKRTIENLVVSLQEVISSYEQFIKTWRMKLQPNKAIAETLAKIRNNQMTQITGGQMSLLLGTIKSGVTSDNHDQINKKILSEKEAVEKMINDVGTAIRIYQVRQKKNAIIDGFHDRQQLDSLRRKAKDQIKNRSFLEAVQTLSQFLDIQQNDTEMIKLRGVCYDQLGEPLKAAKDFERVLEVLNDDDVFYKLGTCYEKLKEREKAIECFSQAIKRNPQQHQYFNNRGCSYISFDKFDLALKDFDEAIKINPSYYHAYYNKGNLYTKMNEEEKALHCFNEAIKITDQVPQIFVNRGNRYKNKKQYRKALQDFSKAIELKPDNPSYYQKRSEMYRKLNKVAEAQQDEQKIAELKQRK